MTTRSKATDVRRDTVLLAVVALVVLLMPFWLQAIGGYAALATKIAIWMIFALGFDILLGFTGFLSFGHAAFFGTSAYVTGLVFKHWTPEVLPAMAASLSATLLASAVIGYLALRRTGIYFAILTLAFAQMLYAAALSIFSDWTGGDNGLTMAAHPQLFGLPMDGLYVYYFIAAILVAVFYLAQRIKRSPFGLMLRSIKSNATRLRYSGVNVKAYEQAAFMISAMYGGLAGSLMIVYEPYVATAFLHWSTSGELVIMSVIGGVGTLIGPMIGAAFVLFFENVVQAFIGEQWKLVMGLVFVAIVTFLPGGFMQGLRWMRDSASSGATRAVRSRRAKDETSAP